MRKANLFLATLLTVMGGVDAMADTQTLSGLTFNDSGNATIPVECLKLTLGDGAEGSYTVADGAGTLIITTAAEGSALEVQLPADGIDMSMVESLSVTQSGDDLVNHLNIYNDKNNHIVDGSGGWWGSKFGVSNAFASFNANATCVKRIVWFLEAAKTGTQTFTAITVHKSAQYIEPGTEVVEASLPNMVDLTADMFKKWDDAVNPTTGETANCAYELNVSSGLPYGDSSVGYLNYADLTQYSKLIITATAGTPRCCFNRRTDGGAIIDNNNDTGKKYLTHSGDDFIFDLAAIVADEGFAHLHAIKGANWANVTVTKMQLLDPNGNSPYGLILTSKGALPTNVKTLLADASLTSIDATGLTGAVTEALPLGNPNCLIVVSDASYVQNTKNVVAGTTCADLDLTDAKPFKAPIAFTATSAKFSKTLDADLEGYSTLVLPFAATTTATAYSATAIDANGYTITLAATNNIAAGKPVIVKGEAGAALNINAQNAAIATNDAMTNGLLTGTYAAATHAPEGSYVLQHQDELTAFYQVAEGMVLTAAPFRAWLTAPAGQQNAPKFIIAGDATGINNIDAAEAGATVRAYNLAGQTVNNNAKGIQIRRTQSGRVVKVAVK